MNMANLGYASLSGANLSEAILREATGWTAEQLTQAKSLKGATMPDGRVLKGDKTPHGPTFKEWLKSKVRGEDGEKSGPS